MKTLIMTLAVCMLLPLYTQAQLGKEIARQHNKAGVTVTLLDRNLYGLYENSNLPQEASDVLNRLDEVNILHIEFGLADREDAAGTIARFGKILGDTDRYTLSKSRNAGPVRQNIYTRSGKDGVSDLVVWNQNPEEFELIELRGDIQPGKLALVAKALNVPGLRSLSSLASRTGEGRSPGGKDLFPGEDGMDREDFFRQMMNLRDQAFGHFFGSGDSLRSMDGFPGSGFFGDLPARLQEFFGDAGDMRRMQEFFGDAGNMHRMQEFSSSFGNGETSSSSSVQVTEENGKTKIKINSRNADISYVIDGELSPKDQVEMPEKIRNVNIIPSRKDPRKSYLFVISQRELGEFISCRDGVLKFRYKGQDYTFNLEKSSEPLLVVDGRLSRSLDTAPEDILQIRPVSQIEQEAGYYPNAKVVVNTR